MKTLKNYLETVTFSLLLFTIVLAGCTVSGNDTNAQTGAEVPTTDIHTAVLNNDILAVEQHIKGGTDINATEPFGGSTPLISAATFGRFEIAKKLIDAGADLSIKNNDGSTALHAAAFFGRVEIVQMLIDADADKTVKNNFGATARESVLAPFEEIRPVYLMMQEQLGPLGLKLDMDEVEKSRPVIAMMLE